ncbi:hypothetical protein B0H17DRAFT_1140126 [Mycena rosella]|uniref:Uncharacterized protein n=1 Tax=Mycena rosella TaxID=1033263 RepID=A0AAD7D356_MYCRO|nr:hypothetical protein B0H17DRAFT_1140126 [Mycena rosella]
MVFSPSTAAMGCNGVLGSPRQVLNVSQKHSNSPSKVTSTSQPLLEGLHFAECTASESEPPDLLPLLLSPKHHLTYLSLSSSASIAQWLVRPGFPLEFSNLVCAEISRSSNGTVAAILEGVRETLRSLTVAGDNFQPIHLVRFPALTHLRIALGLPLDIIATLPTISEITNRNIIREIIYTIETPHLWDGEPQAAAEQRSTWPTFDAGITALPPPHWGSQSTWNPGCLVSMNRPVLPVEIP